MKNTDLSASAEATQTKFLPWAIAVGVIILVWVAYGQLSPVTKNQKSANTVEMPVAESDAMMTKEETPSDAMTKKSEPVLMAGKVSGYQAYSESLVESALKGNQKIYVFFHADWCPSCKALDKDIAANLSTIPADTLVLKADFDSETALKRKYGVTVQTTVVTLGADGSLAKKSLGVSSLTTLLQ